MARITAVLSQIPRRVDGPSDASMRSRQHPRRTLLPLLSNWESSQLSILLSLSNPSNSPGCFGSMPGRNHGRPGSFGILGTGLPTVKKRGVRKRDGSDASRSLPSHLDCIAEPSRSEKGEMSGFTTPQRNVMQEVRWLRGRGTPRTRRGGSEFRRNACRVAIEADDGRLSRRTAKHLVPCNLEHVTETVAPCATVQ